MAQGNDAQEADLLTAVFEILQRHPAGLSEYDVLRLLQRERGESFFAEPFRSHLALFQAHFLLFNALYRLRERLARAGDYAVAIDVHRIALQPFDRGAPGGSRTISPADPLRDYYLDISQLANTDADEVEQLLGGFWARYLAQEGRAAALAELGLADPVDRLQIRRRYRRLAMEHHPDRGGDTDAFRRLLAAKRLLEQCAAF